MSLQRAVLLSIALLSPLSAIAAEDKVFCCTDAAGRRICGDSLPQTCFDRGYREISRGGSIVKEVEPPLTPEQRIRRDAELKVLKDRLTAEAAAKRRDQVLVDSYSTLADLDRRRDRELSIVDSELRISRSRENLLLATLADLEKRKAAAGKKAPTKLLVDIESTHAELNSTRSILTSKQKEYDSLKEHFETDRQRYIELTASQASPGKR